MSKNYKVAGVDEVGRGCLAGPVFAAAVILNNKINTREIKGEKMMDKSISILSDLTHYMKYARFLPEENRRETYEETVTRNKEMHVKKFPFLKKEIDRAYEDVYNKNILPSMRSMQFAGEAIEVNPARMFNWS